MRRREFIALLGGTAASWPLAARAQQPGMPLVGFLNSGSSSGMAFFVTAFRNGLKEVGYIEGRNVAVEYRWAEGQHDRLPALAADLVSRQVTVIAADTRSTLIAKAATTTTPILFYSGGDPVKLGFITSLNRPGGNVTGASFLTTAVAGKRLELLRELIPTATVIDYLVNPDNPLGQPEIADAEAAARTHGLKLQVRNNRPAPARRALCWRRLVLPLPTPRARIARGAACDSCNLQSAGICRGRRIDELRHQHFRCYSPDWHLYRPNSQGRKAS